MSDQDIDTNKYDKLRSIYKYYIDSHIALYQLKTENVEELASIYELIKTNLIDSKKYQPQHIIISILNIIPYNNRYLKSYLQLAKFVYGDYNVTKVTDISHISNCLFYNEYGISLSEDKNMVKIRIKNIDLNAENTITRAIMDNNKEKLIFFTEVDGFDKNQTFYSSLFPDYNEHSLLELCCYYRAVDCFKLLRSKFNSEITKACLQFSFLGGNQEIMSECLKYHVPDNNCMKYAIISHNIDFVTFLMNEYNMEINLTYCAEYNNLESFLVYFDQTNDIDKCFIYSPLFNIPSLCEYFLSLGVDINVENDDGITSIDMAISSDHIEIVELLLSHGVNVNAKDGNGDTLLDVAKEYQCKEIYELLLSRGAINNSSIKAFKCC
ncbi:hypothetical protein TVAG_150690 [Trichomonas vaginalis G3]|uniref:DUF3447 domain-containing protein n=1 Tax=Trichomonas vaginalis (strain ATCC PRA-98 / G3) TaxID=412133 RepID=A2DRX1_TRIV3|nr:protein of unknown function (DUF3447) [Trichomonas vaginalis G3]EAY16918.1 hypothetical protein TVAG_150690 [Trichomonas vaginalis G3]KAI5489096.1 protein of unknown function (DUF3447) [Trichomonas vaginalis G3]|eukprot:XP_001329141.1 hypothetical protein [Trichomonas vaginalis G3]